jgi:hypothetical protein
VLDEFGLGDYGPGLVQSHLNGLARLIRNTVETTERLGGCQISTVSVLDLRTSVPGSGD